MLPTIKIDAILETEDGPILTRDLSYFLYLFRAVYVAGREEIGSQNHFGALTEFQVADFANVVSVRISTADREQLSALALRELDPLEDLAILEICRRNPVDILFAGIALPILAATIIAGGIYQLSPLKITLPPPTAGITSLRAAFGSLLRSRKNRGPN